jgi:hypothetical protein
MLGNVCIQPRMARLEQFTADSGRHEKSARSSWIIAADGTVAPSE